HVVFYRQRLLHTRRLADRPRKILKRRRSQSRVEVAPLSRIGSDPERRFSIKAESLQSDIAKNVAPGPPRRRGERGGIAEEEEEREKEKKKKPGIISLFLFLLLFFISARPQRSPRLRGERTFRQQLLLGGLLIPSVAGGALGPVLLKRTPPA